MGPVCCQLILRNGHDHTVDLWALGVIVFELLSGETAFDEEPVGVPGTFEVTCSG